MEIIGVCSIARGYFKGQESLTKKSTLKSLAARQGTFDQKLTGWPGIHCSLGMGQNSITQDWIVYWILLLGVEPTPLRNISQWEGLSHIL